MIGGVDNELGKIRNLLKAKGIEDNTIIIWMGDNGYFLGERQMAGKWLMYDNSIRVPLIIFDPRVNQHHDVDDMVANVDLASTILDFAGIDGKLKTHGNSLVPYVKTGQSPYKREELLIEHLWEFEPIPPSEGIRTEKWKFMRYRNIEAKEELYDLRNDPWELHNLVDDPNHAKTLQKMRKTLNQWIRETGDLGQNVEPMKMYDSDMKVYLDGLANRGRGDRLQEIKSNIAQMKKWWKEGK